MSETDLGLLAANETPESDPWNFFEIQASNRLHRRFATTGGITDDAGMLAVETNDGTLVGSVSWFTVQHGPSAACHAFNVGISLFAEHRGQGYGSSAQRQLCDYLFSTRLVERVEAGTDLDNVAEQRALASAGFHREGTLRHAQFRAGHWRDVILYSRLRGDGAISTPVSRGDGAVPTPASRGDEKGDAHEDDEGGEAPSTS